MAGWFARNRRRLGLWLFFLVLAGILLFYVFVPLLVQWGMNRVVEDDAATVSEAGAALHARLALADMHADSLLWRRDLTKRGRIGQADFPRLAEGKFALQVFTAVTKSPRGLNYDSNPADSDNITTLAIAQRWPRRTWGSLHQRALYQAEKLREFAARSDGAVEVVTTGPELAQVMARRAAGEAVMAAMLGLEGAHPMEGDLENLKSLYAAGYRTLGLTHFFDNEVGGSAHGLEKGGLTPLGREAVRWGEANGMVIDLAHASVTLIDEVLDMATRPVIVSHTGVKGTCPGNRNLTDDHLRRIAETGGIVGIGFWSGAVCETTVAAIVQAMRYTVDLIGVAHVALGSDFDGSVWTPFDAAGTAKLTSALLDAGFTEAEIAQIMGQNTIGFFIETLPQE